MSGKILDSKIQIPRFFNQFIMREAVVNRLCQFSDKIVVLNAGAGYGKTMLLAHYAHITTEKCGWLHLGDAENDCYSFMDYLGKSLKKVVDTFDYSLVDPVDNSGNHRWIESAAIQFSSAIQQCGDKEIVMIFDDFQEINHEGIYFFIKYLIENTPDNVRFMFSIKGTFPGFLLKYLWAGQLNVLTEKELAFTLSDIKSVLQKFEIQGIEDHYLSGLIAYTEGWPAALMALAIALKQKEEKLMSSTPLPLMCKDAQIHDYLVIEILKKLPVDTQQFLVKTSVLNVLSVELCSAITGNANAKDLLDQLVNQHLFIVRLNGKERIYRYHSIFKDYLNSQLNNEERRKIVIQAANYCLEKGDYPQAAEYVTDLTPQMVNQLSTYYWKNEQHGKAYELLDVAMIGYLQEKNDNDYCKTLLYKANYFGDITKQEEIIQQLNKGIVYFKEKSHGNWYLLAEKKMALYLMHQPIEAAMESAEEILRGSTTTDSLVNNNVLLIKEHAQEVIKEQKQRIKENKAGRDGKIHVHCFANGHIHVVGKTEGIKWRTKKTGELFAFLLDKQGQVTSRDILINALWPEMQLDKALILCHTTLSYLRKALVENQLEHLFSSTSFGYAIHTQYVDSDHNRLIELADKVQNNRYEELPSLEVILDLYKGAYFDAISSEWITGRREHFERVYINCGKQIANYWIACNRFDHTMVLLQKIEKMDPYSEDIMSMTLKVLSALGDMKNLKKRYQWYQKVYIEELGIELSKRIHELYQMLIEKR